MYIIEEFMICTDLATNEKHYFNHHDKMYFQTLKQAQNYIIDNKVQIKDRDYNRGLIEKNKNETKLYSDFITVDNKTKYLTIYEIIKLEKFKGVE